MNIPDEAVDAAAKVYRDQQAELGYPKWDELAEDGREWRRDYMRVALEAGSTVHRGAGVGCGEPCSQGEESHVHDRANQPV